MCHMGGLCQTLCMFVLCIILGIIMLALCMFICYRSSGRYGFSASGTVNY